METGMQKKPSNRLVLIFALLVIVVLFFVFKKNDASPTTVQENQMPASSTVLEPGTEGTINMNADKTNCEGEAFLGTTKENYDALVSASLKKDNEIVAKLILDEKIFSVKNCSKIVKLENAGVAETAQVRILDLGEGQIDLGWTSEKFLQKN